MPAIVAKILIAPMLLACVTMLGLQPAPKPVPKPPIVRPVDKSCSACGHWWDDAPPCSKCNNKSLWRLF